MFKRLRQALGLRCKPSKPQKWTTSRTVFLGEQDGDVERAFKDAVANVLHVHDVACRAYLARVEYSAPGEFNVALCIGTELADTARLRGDLGEAFSRMFNQDEHLDIVFLTRENEDRLTAVCRAFYASP